MHHLQAEHMAVALQLSEPWLREYQVLPLLFLFFVQSDGFQVIWVCSHWVHFPTMPCLEGRHDLIRDAAVFNK
jgi:hypothetical protein